MTLRLVRILLALVLAASMAMFPIAIQRASASVGHDHAATLAHDHEHDAAPSAHDHVSSDDATTLADSLGRHDHASHDGDTGSACCGSIVCHGFGVSAAPSLSVPVAYLVKHIGFQDQHTAGALSVRLDRPPRTV